MRCVAALLPEGGRILMAYCRPLGFTNAKDGRSGSTETLWELADYFREHQITTGAVLLEFIDHDGDEQGKLALPVETLFTLADLVRMADILGIRRGQA